MHDALPSPAIDRRTAEEADSGNPSTNVVPQSPAEESDAPKSGQTPETRSQSLPQVAPNAAGSPNEMEKAEPAPLWLRRTDQAVVAALVSGILLLTAYQLAKVGWWHGEAVEIDRLQPGWYEYKIDINRATWVEWAQLDGIGETLARRIVEDREQRGPFRNVDDVLRVKGIGPKKLEQIRRHLYVQTAQQ